MTETTEQQKQSVTLHLTGECNFGLHANCPGGTSYDGKNWRNQCECSCHSERKATVTGSIGGYACWGRGGLARCNG